MQPYGDSPPQYSKKRKCVECGAVLSIYNPGKRCLHHDDPYDDRLVSQHRKK